jgi:prepilin-type N-terminal cleavage/methylation domain-containing protein
MRNEAGFSMLEMMITIGIIAILSAITAPNIIGWLKHQGLKSAVIELQSDLQLTKLAAVKQNQDCSINFNTGTGSYSIPCIGKTVPLSNYSGGVVFGGPGGEATDPQITYSSRSITTNGQQVYLTNGDNTGYYRITVLTSGGIVTAKWNGSQWK